MKGWGKQNLTYVKDMAITKAQERQWQAEEDARTMARYHEIMDDSQRKQRAVRVAKQQAADLSKRASAMNKVATTKVAKRK